MATPSQGIYNVFCSAIKIGRIRNRISLNKYTLFSLEVKVFERLSFSWKGNDKEWKNNKEKRESLKKRKNQTTKGIGLVSVDLEERERHADEACQEQESRIVLLPLLLPKNANQRLLPLFILSL